MFRRSQKSQYLDEANQFYIDGHYTDAYIAYSNVLNAAQSEGEMKYCEIGMLRCQVKTHAIPVFKLINRIRDLQKELTSHNKEWWVIECEQVLDAMMQMMFSPKRKAEYASLSGVKLTAAITAKNISQAFEVYPLDYKNDPHAEIHFVGDICLGLSTACDIYKSLNMMADADKTLNLLASCYEYIGDAYVDYIRKKNNVKMWEEDGFDGPEPFLALRSAIQHYEMAITSKGELGQVDLTLLFSPLCVAHMALDFFNADKCHRYFNLQTLIDKFSLEKAVTDIGDSKSRAYWQRQLNAYKKCAADISKFCKKRKAESQAIDGVETTNKLPRTELNLFGKVSPKANEKPDVIDNKPKQ